MILLLFGLPGCGKGTQAAFIASRFHIPAISTGEMFRAECASGSAIGKKAAAILAKGGLVGDDIVNQIVARRIAQADCASGFLMDGYPRTVGQARFLGRWVAERQLPPPVVLHLDVPVDALVDRLCARRQCPACKRIYNLLSQPPKIAGVCDDDGAALSCRGDDCADVARRRIRTYKEASGPLLAFYGPSTIRIDADRPVDVIAADIGDRLVRVRDHQLVAAV